MKLISMLEYIEKKRLKVEDMTDCVDFTSEVCAYAKFLKQPLKLEMFIPCDEDGNVLEEPNTNYLQPDDLPEEFEEECAKYQEAKEKALFYIENIKRVVQVRKDKILIEYNKDSSFSIENGTIESLVNWCKEVNLKESAIKQL